MAWCKLEDTFHDDPKFRRLSDAMGFSKKLGPEKGAALARGMVASLWSWAARHAPDGRLDGATPAEIERICGHVSGNGALYQRLRSAGFIDETPLGAATQRTIHRYWERAESHKAAQRKKKRRDEEIDVPRQSRPPSEPENETVSLIREDREDREDTYKTESAVRVCNRPVPRKTKLVEPLVLAEFKELAIKHGRSAPNSWDDVDHRDAGRIYAKYPTYRPVLEKYLAEQFYERWGWSLKYLANNLDAIANRKQPDEVIPGKRAEIREWSEMQAEREAQWQRELDEENARLAAGENT